MYRYFRKQEQQNLVRFYQSYEIFKINNPGSSKNKKKFYKLKNIYLTESSINKHSFDDRDYYWYICLEEGNYDKKFIKIFLSLDYRFGLNNIHYIYVCDEEEEEEITNLEIAKQYLEWKFMRLLIKKKYECFEEKDVIELVEINGSRVFKYLNRDNNLKLVKYYIYKDDIEKVNYLIKKFNFKKDEILTNEIKFEN